LTSSYINSITSIAKGAIARALTIQKDRCCYHAWAPLAIAIILLNEVLN